MFQLLKKYRKGVSPVIAIVLLIALTVAAAAVIWTLTSGILDDATGNTLVVSSSASANVAAPNQLVITVTLRANSITTLSVSKTSMLTHANSSAVGTNTFSFNSLTLESGDTSVVITIDSTANDFSTGLYEVNLSWAGVGDDSKLLKISATA